MNDVYESYESIILSSDGEESSVENNTSNVNVSVQQIPIVYTKKLDDMFIFQNTFDNMTINDITEWIITESKPVLRKLPKRARPLNQQSYNNIVEKINLIYKTARSYVDNRQHDVTLVNKSKLNYNSRQLLSLCKPLRVKLKDFTKYPETITPIKFSSIQEVPNPYNLKQLLLFNGIGLSSLKNIRRNIFINVCFLFYNRSNNELNIYHINDTAELVRHDTINGVFPSLFDGRVLLRHIHAEDIVKLECCCWYERRKMILTLKKQEYFIKETLECIAKPHTCLPNECVCCCARLKTCSTKKDSKMNKNAEEKKNYIQDLLKKIKGTESLITKALKFSSKLKNIRAGNLNSKKRVLSSKIYGTLQLKTNKALHIYELEENGNLRTYKTNRQNKDEECEYEKCCWMNHQTVLKDVSCKDKKFILGSHKCPIQNCRCCCKPEKSVSSQAFSDIFIPTQLRHATKFIKTSYNFSRFNRKVSKDDKVKDVDEFIRHETQNKVIVSRNSSLNSLVESITPEFENIYLSIDENGKFIASLPMPVKTLSTSELKVLAKIFTAAKRNVEILNFQPGHKFYLTKQNINLISCLNTETDLQPANKFQTQTIKQVQITNPIVNHKSYPNINESAEANILNFSLDETPTDIEQSSSSLCIPRIENVFSLQAVPNSTLISNNSTNTYTKPDKAVVNENTASNRLLTSLLNSDNDTMRKRKLVADQKSTFSKIRVVSPSKLGILNETNVETLPNQPLILQPVKLQAQTLVPSCQSVEPAGSGHNLSKMFTLVTVNDSNAIQLNEFSQTTQLTQRTHIVSEPSLPGTSLQALQSFVSMPLSMGGQGNNMGYTSMSLPPQFIVSNASPVLCIDASPKSAVQRNAINAVPFYPPILPKLTPAPGPQPTLKQSRCYVKKPIDKN